MSQRKNAIIESQLERGSPEERSVGAVGAGSLPLRWWRTMVGSLAAGRHGRYQATLKRLAQSDAADTVSEADVQSWLKMLETESARQAPPATASRLQSRE